GIIQTESGNITINATGAVNGGVDCPGLSLQGPTSGSGIVRTNAGGNIIINATGGGNNSSPGVSITRGTISTTGGGDITINATGGGGNASDGVQIVGPAPAAGNSAIQTIGLPGDIFITATGGSSGTGNNGVNVINGGQIFAGDGIIVIDGTGGPNGGGSYGVSVTGSGSDITARFGTFDVTGRAGGGGSEGILVSGGGVITALNGSGVINTFSDLIVSNGSSISASGGTLTVNVARDILLENGGSLSSQLQNNVRAGRDITLNGMLGLGATIFSSTSDIQVLAGRNFTMNAAVNFAAFVGALGNITIVVDNAFPSPPDIGPGSFSKDANSVILANIDGSNNLRIFTARQSQNNIQGTLNLFPFVPGIEFVNTNQEQWETYFPSGFGGNPFTIFYKNTNRQTIITLINELMVANAQISDFLPFFPRVRTPFEFSYVGEFCDYDPADHHLHCRPNFAPYGSFIFEDRVFWIGRSWDPSSQTTLMDYLKHRK
ncbi:MAG: hypothetical protein KDK64_05285, partial [Chlamydiia bacterium]|nr:hypothetical protein [Chlamydiia bacterium]